MGGEASIVRLVQVLGEYFEAVSEEITATDGTVDKYIGDAVMAFWGAPIPHPHHAEQAVGAGLAMLRALDDLNADFAQKGWPEIRIGVGINTGMMSVGNMGSAFPRAYTVLGDAVNLGSRLEGITKVYGVEFIVSGETARQAARYLYRELDRVQVKGKAKPVTILEPIGLEYELSVERKAEVKAFHDFLKRYRGRRWDEAEAAETGYANYLLADPILGYSKEDHLDQFRFIANRRAKSLNMEKPFPGIDEAALPWLDEQANMRKEKNFFETRVTEYQTGGALSWD